MVDLVGVAVGSRPSTHATADAELVAFCDREYPRLVAALDLICGDSYVAEDLAQEALVRVWDRWARVSRYESPGGWAHRVAVNLARSHVRRRMVEQRANRRSDDRRVVDPVDAGVADRLAIRAALAGLTARQREAIVLRHYLGHSVAEAAAIMGVPEGTVKAHTQRGLTRMRDVLGTIDVDGEEA